MLTTSTLLALLAGAAVGGGLLLLVLALRGLPARDPGTPSLLSRAGQGAGRFSGRLSAAVVTGLIVLVLTGWPVMSVGIGLLVAYWDRVAGGGGEERLTILRLEALSVWTEAPPPHDLARLGELTRDALERVRPAL